MEETFELTLSDSAMNNISSTLNEIPLTVTTLELIIPGFLDDATWQYNAGGRYFIEDYLPQMMDLFSNISWHIKRLKIESSSNLTMGNVSFINEIMPGYFYYSLYCSRAKVIASLFAKLPSNIKEINFSSISFSLVPLESLKLMASSLPFIKTVNISSVFVNKMSKEALIHFSAIAPNTIHYNVDYNQTPKLNYLISRPKKHIQYLHDAVNLLAQQDKLPFNCIGHIIKYLARADDVDYAATSATYYQQKLSKREGSLEVEQQEVVGQHVRNPQIVLLFKKDLSIPLPISLSSFINENSRLQLSFYLYSLMDVAFASLLFWCCSFIRDDLLVSLPLAGAALVFCTYAINNMWEIYCMQGQFYEQYYLFRHIQRLYDNYEKLYALASSECSQTLKLDEFKKYSFFNKSDNFSTCSHVEVESTPSLIA